MNLLSVSTENVSRYNIAYMFGSVVQECQHGEWSCIRSANE